MTDEYDLDAGPDPTAFAAAAPEDRPETPVHAVGIGPGDTDFLTPRGERHIQDADVVVGFETVIDYIGDLTDADLLVCGYRDEAETLDRFAQRVADGDRGTAVLMGDPNHSGYQFVGKVESAVDCPVRIVPGISSLQIAASRARTPMENTTFVTLHKSGDLSSDLDRLRADVGERHLLILPRPYDLMPGDIATDLLDAGADPDRTALVYERLTHSEETRTVLSLESLSAHAGGNSADETPFSDLSVLVVRQN